MDSTIGARACFRAGNDLRWLTPLALASLVALDIYLLFRVIVPGLSPG